MNHTAAFLGGWVKIAYYPETFLSLLNGEDKKYEGTKERYFHP
jgi:hypothetical protein